MTTRARDRSESNKATHRGSTAPGGHAAGSGRDHAAPDPDAWWLPLDEAAPAGPWLEYDTAYAALATRMVPGAEVQYGDFTQRREPPPWSELERECRGLLRRSRDIVLLVWWVRCRVHESGAEGLRQGLGMLLRVLRGLGGHVHPQATIDGEHDPALRANALAALADPETLLLEVRDLAVFGGGGELRRVRDVERAESGDDAAREDLRARLLQAWHEQDARLRALHEAHHAVVELAAWAREDLGANAPDLVALQRLLGAFAEAPQREPGPIDASRPDPEPAERLGPLKAPWHLQAEASPRPAAAPPAISPARERTGEAASGEASAPCLLAPHDRRSAQACIAQAREWFETHEPSSPVGVLLRQAERLVGKRYVEVAQALPPDLLARWEDSP